MFDALFFLARHRLCPSHGRTVRVILNEVKNLVRQASDKSEILRLRLRITRRAGFQVLGAVFCSFARQFFLPRPRFGGEGRVRGLVFALVLLLGCQQKMADQPRYDPLTRSTFFGDERSARPLVEGTVARGQLRTDEHLYTGKERGKVVDTFPFPVTRAVLARGQERFNIFCSPCHDRVGNGQGMIVRRGYRAPPSYHIDRLRQAPVGHFFQVMTSGFGAMPDYAQQISPEDRWAIAAYIRALQLSQHAALADVPPEQRRQLSGAQP
jgi:cytochrome c553